jgi:C4-type Zn-finger protein
MKKGILTTGLLFAMTAALFTSCGGGDEKTTEERKPKDYTLTVEKALGGDFSKYFEVTKATLKIEEIGSKLMVEVKRTDAEFEGVDVNHMKFENEGSEKYVYDITADLLGENDVPVETSLKSSNSDGFAKLRSMKSGETAWLEFDAGREADKNPTKAKKVKLSSTLKTDENYGKISASSGDAEGTDAEGTDAEGTLKDINDAGNSMINDINEKAKKLEKDADDYIKSGKGAKDLYKAGRAIKDAYDLLDDDK